VNHPLKTEINVPEDVLPLVSGFLKRRLSELSELRDALDKNDFDSLRMIGHRLAGNGAAFGYPVLSRIGAELEASATAKDRQKSMNLVEQLGKTVQQLCRDFERKN
jgi:HPt (histidine-containing phosphotransfer) domain-containing protein